MGVLVLQASRNLARSPCPRRSRSAAVQLALLVAASTQTPMLCTAAPLASPAAQRMTHQLFRLLSALARMAAIPGPAPAGGGGGGQQPSPAAECVTIMSW